MWHSALALRARPARGAAGAHARALASSPGGKALLTSLRKASPREVAAVVDRVARDGDADAATPDFFTRLAAATAQLPDHALTERVLETAKQQDKQTVAQYNHLLLAYLRSRKFHAANQLPSRMAAAGVPPSPETFEILLNTQLHRRNVDVREAEALFERAGGPSAASCKAHMHLMRVYGRSGDLEAVGDVWRRAEALHPDEAAAPGAQLARVMALSSACASAADLQQQAVLPELRALLKEVGAGGKNTDQQQQISPIIRRHAQTTLTHVAYALGKADRGGAALALLRWLADYGGEPVPRRTLLHAVLLALAPAEPQAGPDRERRLRWMRQLLARMWEDPLWPEPVSKTYAALVRPAVRGAPAPREEVQALLNEMIARGVSPGADVLLAAMRALYDEGDFQGVLTLFTHMDALGVAAPPAAYALVVRNALEQGSRLFTRLTWETVMGEAPPDPAAPPKFRHVVEDLLGVVVRAHRFGVVADELLPLALADINNPTRPALLVFRVLWDIYKQCHHPEVTVPNGAVFKIMTLNPSHRRTAEVALNILFVNMRRQRFMRAKALDETEKVMRAYEGEPYERHCFQALRNVLLVEPDAAQRRRRLERLAAVPHFALPHSGDAGRLVDAFSRAAESVGLPVPDSLEDDVAWLVENVPARVRRSSAAAVDLLGPPSEFGAGDDGAATAVADADGLEGEEVWVDDAAVSSSVIQPMDGPVDGAPPSHEVQRVFGDEHGAAEVEVEVEQGMRAHPPPA